MEYFSGEAWVKVCGEFFDAYVNFRLDGTSEHLIEHNGRKIEIYFFDHVSYTSVELYCPSTFKAMLGYYDGSAKYTKEIIRMILWLALNVEDLENYEINTFDLEEEHKKLRELLVQKVGLCYENDCAEYWKGIGEVSFILNLHNRRFHIYIYPDALWDTYSSVVVDIYCFDTNLSCSMFISQTEDYLDDLVSLIQDMSLEPEIAEFCISDSTREHELIREALIGLETKHRRYIFRWPFFSPSSIMESKIITDRYITLHKRIIRIQFDQKEKYINIIVSCLTTGKTCSLELPKDSDYNELEEVYEELVYKIQELAWEFI